MCGWCRGHFAYDSRAFPTNLIVKTEVEGEYEECPPVHVQSGDFHAGYFPDLAQLNDFIFPRYS